MNTQMERQCDNPSQQSEHHDHHQSVLKKVKAKAKKIKNSITKHGHSHDDDIHAHDNIHAHEKEADYDEDEIEEDPEFHGAPMYESQEVRSRLPGQHDVVLGHGPVVAGHHVARQDCRSFIPEQVGVSKEAGGVTFGGSQTQPTTAKTNLPILVKQPVLGLGVNHPTVTANEHNSTMESLQQPNKAYVFDRPTSLEPDSRAPGGDNQPENYESKVKNPTGRGGQEIGATPILHSLDKMNMYNDQGVVHHNSGTQGLADKAALAKDVLASKLTAAPVQTSSVTDYGKKVASTVYDKGVSAKEYIAEKVAPKEEDKALSEVISGALPVSSSKDDDNEKKTPGKVTFTTKVVRQLGAEDEKDIGSGGSGPGETVVDLLKDTVTSWLGVGGSNEPSTLVYHDIPQTGNDEGLADHNHHTADGKPRLE